MTKMNVAARRAILGAAAGPLGRDRMLHGSKATLRVCDREGWARNGRITRAGLVAAEVNMDELAAAALYDWEHTAPRAYLYRAVLEQCGGDHRAALDLLQREALREGRFRAWLASA